MYLCLAAGILTIIFILLGVLHIYWASGGQGGIGKAIPVVEGKPAFEPGKAATLVVACGLLAVAGVSYSLGCTQPTSHAYDKYITYVGWILTCVFIVRAVGDFNYVGFFKKHIKSDFATYDTKYYSPFCLCAGVIFAGLSWTRV